MSIREQLLVEHSRANSDRVAAYVLSWTDNLKIGLEQHGGPAGKQPRQQAKAISNQRLVELMACFFSDEVLVAQRAAHVVGLLGREDPQLLVPWWDELVQSAANPIHDAIRRNAIRYFSEQPEPLPKKLETRLIKLCGQFVADEKYSIAVGAFAMQFIADRATEYPHAAQKLCRDLRRRMDAASPGFRNRAEKILVKLTEFK